MTGGEARNRNYARFPGSPQHALEVSTPKGAHRLMVRSLSIISVALGALLLLCMPDLAIAQQLTPGSVSITVTDASTGAPIDNVEVFLIADGRPQSSLTDAKGKLKFSAVQPGLYRVEAHRAGYDRGDAQEFEVTEGAAIAVAIKLAPTLKEIGSVSARSSILVTTERITEDSAERKLSQSLKDALGKLAGVSVDDSDYENSAFNISLRNHDASQTGYTIDGAPIAGAASQSLGAAQGLFSGASVNFAPTAGYLGGTINFQTLRPTKTWVLNGSGTIGNFGSAVYSFSATGSAGHVAMALQHTMSARDSLLSGLTYADQSGKSFEHVGGTQSLGDLLKFSVPLTRRATLDLSAFITNSGSAMICNDFVTLARCGFGTVPQSWNHSTFASASVNALIGNVQVNVFGNSSTGIFSYQDLHRTLGQTSVSALQSLTHYVGTNIGANVSITARRHTMTFGYDAAASRQRSVQTSNGSAVDVPQVPQRFSNTYVEDKIKANDHLAVTHGLSVAAASGSGTSFVVFESVDWTPAKNDAYGARVSIGGAQPNYGFSNVLTDPLNASFDCYNRSTFVSGPQDQPQRQSSVSYNLSWSHKFRHGSMNASVYRQNAYGQQLFAAIPLGAEPASIFPNGRAAYIAGLAAVWASSSVCGAIPFDPSKVYVAQSVSGTAQVNQGFTVSGRLALGNNVTIFPNYTVASAYLSQDDPRLAFPGSFYATGLQLPRRPLRTAGILVDGTLPKSHLEWLLNAAFTDVNNQANQPAYTLFNAGVVFHTKYGGTLTLVESNMFGTHSGLFSSYIGVDPRPLAGGGSFAYATTPLAPRQWALTWRVPWQQKAQAPLPAPPR